MDDSLTESIPDIDTDSFIKEGLELYSMGKKKEAIAFWQDILNFNPDYEQCQHYLEIALIDEKNQSTDKESFQTETIQKKTIQKEAIQKDSSQNDFNEPSFKEIYTAAMSAYIQRNYSEAEKLFKQCLIIQPNDKRALHNLDRITNR